MGPLYLIILGLSGIGVLFVSIVGLMYGLLKGFVGYKKEEETDLILKNKFFNGLSMVNNGVVMGVSSPKSYEFEDCIEDCRGFKDSGSKENYDDALSK